MRTSGHQSNRSSYLVPGRYSRRSRPSSNHEPDPSPPPPLNKKKSNVIVILGILLPVLAAVIGVTAWAISTDTFVASPSGGESAHSTFDDTQSGEIPDRRHRMLENSLMDREVQNLSPRGKETQMAASSLQTMRAFVTKTTSAPRQVHIITVNGPPPIEPSPLTTKDVPSSPLTTSAKATAASPSAPPLPGDLLSQIISASKNSGHNPPHFLVIAPLHDGDLEPETKAPPNGNRRSNNGGLGPSRTDIPRKTKPTAAPAVDDEERQESEVHVEQVRRNRTMHPTPRSKPRRPPPPPVPRPQHKFYPNGDKPPRIRGPTPRGRLNHMNGGRDQRPYRQSVAMSSPPKSYRPPEPNFMDKSPQYQGPPPQYQGSPMYDQNYDHEGYHNDDMHYQDNYGYGDSGGGSQPPPPQHDSDRLGNLGIGLGIPKGITLTIGGFKPLIPSFSPFGILKGIVGSLLPKPHVDLNHRIYFGVELGKGVGIGKG